MLYDTFRYVREFALLYPDKITSLTEEELLAFMEDKYTPIQTPAAECSSELPEQERLAG
ncbi:hypothetical protein NXH76_01280 [Blautia schinkii]|nr:hypothetical protein [Blautia schinkii]